uniref:Sushi domain-containing protein n=1 Tax=Salarias fasciatus TaxID=181472 RepID=A0A672GXE4_SALFA
MEPASPLLSAGFIMVCFLGAVRLSTGDESHCPCPKIPPWPLTEDPPEKCHQISDTFRYTCLVGYVRKAGTSNLIKCELKNKVGQWQNSTLQCIGEMFTELSFIWKRNFFTFAFDFTLLISDFILLMSKRLSL